MDLTFPIRRPSPVVTPARLISIDGRPVARQAEPRGSRGLQLTTRGRVVVAGLALAIALPSIGFGGQAFASGGAPTPAQASVAVIEHTVVAGDTLWSLAGRIATPGEDVRDVVAQLKAINGMASADIFAGQTLLLPQD